MRRGALGLLGLALVGVAVLLALRRERPTARQAARPEEVQVGEEERRAPAEGVDDAQAGRSEWFLVRDLADGSPAAGVGLEIGLAGGGEPVERRTDREGRFSLPSALLAQVETFRPADPGWVCARRNIAWILDRRELSIHALLRVTGTVEFEGAGGDPSTVRLESAPDREARTSIDNQPLGRPEADGSFDVQVPRVAGMALRGEMAGWRPVWQAIPVDSSTTSARVTLVFRKALVVRGTVRRPDGSGAPWVGIGLTLVFAGPRAEVEELAGRVRTSGFTYSGHTESDRVVLRVPCGARTGTDGSFSVELPADGPLYLVLYRRGFEPIEEQLGRAGALEGPLDIRLRAAEGRRILLTEKRAPLANRRFQVTNYGLGDCEPGFTCETDAKGYATVWHLRGGCVYGLFDVAKAFGESAELGDCVRYFRWSGQSELEWTQLEADHDAAMTWR